MSPNLNRATATASRTVLACGRAARGARWPWPRRACAAAGIGVCLAAAYGLAAPLASMASYTAGLMALSQIAPPLLLIGIPASADGRLFPIVRPAFAWLADPSIAVTIFMLFGVVVSLPGIFDPSVANALYAAPLGVLELLVGMLFWTQILPARRAIARNWLAGAVAIVGGIPMTVVALVWMLSDHVLYTPYVDVICRWDIPPLLDQKWAGLVMFVAGMPLQLLGFWYLIMGEGSRASRSDDARPDTHAGK